jgi:FixJ family two-component response regulator
MQEQVVFIVDDDAAVRDSIRELVESVGLRAKSYASAQAFLDAFQPERSGCLIADVRIPGMGGLALQEKLKERGVRIPVIIITGHGDVPMAVRALRTGAANFIQKPYRDQLLLDSIHEALEADATARRSSAQADDLDQRLAALTEREQEVLEKMRTGCSSKQIARDMGISHRTVEAHRQNMLQKLSVASTKELLALLTAPHRDN